MDFTHDDQNWNRLTYKEKTISFFSNRKLSWISLWSAARSPKAQHDKSLHDLMEKMGEKERGAISQ